LAESETNYFENLSVYVIEFSKNLQDLSLGQIAMTSFDIPEAPA